MSVGIAAGRTPPTDPGVTRNATGAAAPDATGNWDVEVSYLYSDAKESLPSTADTIAITGPNDGFHIPLPIGDARVTGRYVYFKKPADTFKRPGIGGTIANNSTTSEDVSAQLNGGTTAPQSSAANYPAGSTYVYVQDTARFSASGTVQYGASYSLSFTYTGRSTSSGAGALTGIPPSGAGSISSAIAVGDNLNDVRAAASLASTPTVVVSTTANLRGRSTLAIAPAFGISATAQLRAKSRLLAQSTVTFSTSALLVVGASITIRGTDVRVVVSTIEIRERKNSGAATATFRIVGSAFTPVEGDTVTIIYGATTLFSGQITDLTRQQEAVSTSVIYDVSADQWGKLIDRRVLYAKFVATSISTIVTSILGTNTSGFTSVNVQGALASVDFTASGNRMSQALMRLADLASAVLRVLPSKDVYFRSTTNLPAPATINATNTDVSDLRYHRSLGDIRTRVYAKGATVPIAASVLASQQAVPLQSTGLFSGATLILLSGQRYSCSSYLAGGVATTLSAAAAAGDTTLNLADTNSFPSQGWALVDGHYVYWGGKTNGTPGTLTGVPASGAGALTVAVPSGTGIVTAPIAVVQPSQEALSAGGSAQLIVQRDDVTAQTALAALEGGDGIHELEVENTNLDSVGALQALADAELALGKNVLESASFTSQDLNAAVGAVQVFNLPGVVTSLPIIATRIYWASGQKAPWIDCESGTVQKTLAQFLADLANITGKAA